MFCCYTVSRHLRLTFVLKNFMKIMSFPQFMVLFCRNCTYFNVQFDFIQWILPFCELMLKTLQFQAKRREGSSSWCLAKRALCVQRVTSTKRGAQLDQRVGKPQKRINQSFAHPTCRKLAQQVVPFFSRTTRPAR